MDICNGSTHPLGREGAVHFGAVFHRHLRPGGVWISKQMSRESTHPRDIIFAKPQTSAPHALTLCRHRTGCTCWCPMYRLQPTTILNQYILCARTRRVMSSHPTCNTRHVRHLCCRSSSTQAFSEPTQDTPRAVHPQMKMEVCDSQVQKQSTRNTK